ncbi:DUF3788 family protein [uncultured Enterococcus sp.]|uniref:DUF3788 family protein n=1 Tax=uncultured Enterococcus sp. TaxID=167972 RepID=UPI002AA8FBB8|nr:DUF3788 family protein [uncultured Enterococcus sp.]
MTISYFSNKEGQPERNELIAALGDTFSLWEKADQTMLELCPEAVGYWKFPTKKAGWTWINAQKKRVLLYRQPCENHFRATIVLGEKVVTELLSSESIPIELKEKVAATTSYAEGRSILVDVHGEEELEELLLLLPYKLK